MAQKSKITQLDPRVRAAVDDAIREGRATIDEIVLLIRGMGGEASRSSVGRYVKNAAAQLKQYRDAQEIAKAWVGRLNAQPEDDVGRMLAEMFKTLAMQTMAQLGDEEQEGPAQPMELMLLAKALDHLTRSQKTTVDRAVKIREALGAKLEQLEGEAKKGGGLDVATIQRIREEVYGIAA
jgi:hypothetical protein